MAVERFTVNDLIAQLQELEPDLGVVLQSDPEGNGYFFGSGAEEAYVPTEDYESRDRTDECRTLEDLKEEADEDDDPTEGFTKVVVVFP